MAGSLNKVQLIGNLGQDPEVRYMPNGKAVANLSLATSETWKDKQSGEKMEKTEWHRVSIFGPSTEFAQKYLNKGSKVYIEGALQTRNWTDKQGQERYTTEIVVQGYSGKIMGLDKPPQNQQQGQQQGNQQQNGQHGDNSDYNGGF